MSNSSAHDVQDDLQVASVSLLVSSKDLGLTVTISGGWQGSDDERALRLAHRSADSESNDHVHLVRLMENKSEQIVSSDVQVIKGPAGATPWQVSLKDGDDKFTTIWECLAVDADDAADQAEAANPGLEAAHETQIDLRDLLATPKH